MAEEPQKPHTVNDPTAADHSSAGSGADGAGTAGDVASEALEHVDAAVSGLKSAAGIAGAGSPLELPSLKGAAAGATANASDLKLLGDVNLHVKVELGRTRMFIEDVLKLNENSVIELDKLAGDPVDIYVNDQHVARGEVLVLNDNFCVRVSEVIQPVGDAA